MALKAGRRGVARELVNSVNGQLNLGEIGLLTADETKEMFLDVLPDLFDTAPNIEASGNPITLVDSAGGNAECVVSFEHKQSGSGTPSPENVRPISGLTEADVTRTGFNIFDEQMELGDINTGTGQNVDDEAYLRCVDYIPIDSSRTYYIRTANTCRKWLFFYDANENYLGHSTVIRGNTNTEFQTPTNSAYMRFLVDVSAYGSNTYQHDICINISSASINGLYYPYVAPSEIYTVDLDGTRYGGTVDFKTGVLTVTHLMATYDGSDDESWTMYGSGSASAYAVIGRLPSVAEFTPNVFGVLKANYLENITAQATWGDYDYFISQSNAMTGMDFVIGLKDISTSEAALRTYLGEHSLTICYKLATPTTVELTPDEVALLAGENVLTTNGDEIDLSYPVDVRKYLIRKLNITTE